MGRFVCDGCDAVHHADAQKHTRVMSVINGNTEIWDFYTCDICQVRLLSCATLPANWMNMPLEVQSLPASIRNKLRSRKDSRTIPSKDGERPS
jgi:hypothetical protein